MASDPNELTNPQFDRRLGQTGKRLERIRMRQDRIGARHVQRSFEPSNDSEPLQAMTDTVHSLRSRKLSSQTMDARAETQQTAVPYDQL